METDCDNDHDEGSIGEVTTPNLQEAEGVEESGAEAEVEEKFSDEAAIPNPEEAGEEEDELDRRLREAYAAHQAEQDAFGGAS